MSIYDAVVKLKNVTGISFTVALGKSSHFFSPQHNVLKGLVKRINVVELWQFSSLQNLQTTISNLLKMAESALNG